MPTSYFILLLSLMAAALALAIGQAVSLRAKLIATQLDCQRLENALHHNCNSIRWSMGYGFPQAVAVCNALEATLPTRCLLDPKKLELQLIGLQRNHNARLLETARAVATKECAA